MTTSQTALPTHLRIKPIDGLRTIAALGVVWIHCWIRFDNPSLMIAGTDFYKLIAIVGNGVDFFFVISGFCMYLMTAERIFTTYSIKNFLWKRFLRIAPAFYAAIIVYACILLWFNREFDFFYNVVFHFLFLNNIVTGNTISGPFWSISTEWHFYLLLPVLFLIFQRLKVIPTVIIFSLCSILLFMIVNLEYLSFRWWETQVLVRFPEFGVGIIAAYLFKKNYKLPKYLAGVGGLLIGLAIMYAGRYMQYTPFLISMGSAGFIFKSLAPTIMTAGFSLILFHVVTEKSRLSDWLSGKFITYLGRISYSIYLWHSFSILMLVKLFSLFQFGPFDPIVAFFTVAILTIFISHFSYRYLEAFYFKRR